MRVRPTAWQRGYTTEYQRNRRWLLQSNPLCALCNVAKATTADHVLPLSKGGTNHIDNLRPACGPCNYRRGNRTA
ncbi:HNH endonuclease [Streptomyces blattellae]|uniref:HNH endonuclease n=1 Tax=Streptomyces blattellae TaxID=2569855 RepID=UPI0012B883C4